MSGPSKLADSRPHGFTISRRKALAGLAAAAAAPVALAGSGLGTAPPVPDPWLVLAEEHTALTEAVVACDEADDVFERLSERCWTRAEAIEMQIGHSQPASLAGALAWLDLMQRDVAEAHNLVGVYDGTVHSIARAAVDALWRLASAADRSAVAPVLAARGGAAAINPPDPGADPWVGLADQHVAACADAQAGWVDGELPDSIADDCWGRCWDAVYALHDAEPGAAGIACWLRLYALPEEHEMAPFSPLPVQLIMEQAVAMLCALSTEAALAVARLETQLAGQREGGA